MRTFKKSSATAAAVLGILGLVLSLISLIVTAITAETFVGLGSTLLSMTPLILLIVILLRGKVDLFAGIVFAINALFALIAVISGLISMGSVYGGFYFSNIENIFLLVIYAMMALDCFIGLNISKSAKTLLYCGAIVAYCFLDFMLYLAYLIKMLGGGNGIVIISSVFGYLLGALPGHLCRILAAAAMAGATAPAAQAAAHSYQSQQSGYSYQQQAGYGYQNQQNGYGYQQHNAYGYQQQNSYGYQNQQNAYGYQQQNGYGYQQQAGYGYQNPQNGYQQNAYGYQQPQAHAAAPRDPKDQGYVSMASHILLCLFTFGIWPLIWVFKTTEVLNRAPGSQQHNPVSQLLLYLFIPFYAIYWFYKQASRADLYGRSLGLTSECATICLILAIFLPLGAIILLQDKINKIAEIKARI